MVQWLKLPAWRVGDRGFAPHPGLQVSKKQNVSFSLTPNDSILWNLRDRQIVCSASDRQGPNFSLYSTAAQGPNFRAT